MLLPITTALAEEVDLRSVVEVEIVTIEGFTVIGLEIHSSDALETASAEAVGREISIN